MPLSAYEMRSNRENRVRVDVKPVQLKPGQPARFEVRMNTHSETLGEEMVAVSSLNNNAGRVYKATAWQGSEPGGHHIFSPPRHEIVRVHGFKGSGVQGCILVPGLDLGCVFTRKASASSGLIQNLESNWLLFGK
jgi:hypothetical protein